MDIQELLSMLHGVRGPNGSGEYQCKCPAHDDRKASLSVRAGEKGIVLHCQAGCEPTDVCRALGITVRDLFYQPRQSKPGKPTAKRQTAVNAKPAAAVNEGAPAPSPKSIQDTFGYLGAIEKVYDYTDDKGKLLFCVVRIRQADGKTFRQCRPAQAGRREPVLPGVDNKDKHVLYRLPEVMAAISAHKPVIVVEGEKDADNLAALGYTATTCSMGAGKWADECSAQLTGADVYIMGDNDEPGRAHAEEAAAALMGVAESVHVCDVKSVCPALPIKGDISDALELTAPNWRADMVKAIIAAAQVREMTPEMRLGHARALYNRILRGSSFGASGNSIVQYTTDNPDGKPLTTFIALPTQVVEMDDGVNVEKVFEIEGWGRGGRELPTARVTAADFSGMGWLAKKWDFAANIMPGNTCKDKVRYVITEVGAQSARHTTVYAHTGWRQINGKWAYLYQGGAIGADDVQVDLGKGLGGYTLDAETADTGAVETVLGQYMLRAALPEHIYVPLIGTMYLAPLREFLVQAGHPPSFVLFLLGSTGTRKSTAAALGLSLFGDFNARTLPASFNDTANTIRKKAFLLKDMPLVIDDYHPETSRAERQRMEAVAQSLARAFGDGAERGRMKADLSLQDSMPPRSVGVISGEDMPDIGESGTARYFIVNVRRGDVGATDALTKTQSMAKHGAFRRIMRGYIEYLGKRADELPDELEARFLELRQRAMNESADGAHGRAPETVAHIMLGYETMLKYFASTGAITQEDMELEFSAAWQLIMYTSQNQAREAMAEKPSHMFMSAVNEMLQTKMIRVRDLTDIEAGDPPKDWVGYCDDMYYYFLPGITYRYVAKLTSEQGHDFPVGERTLWRQMKEEGLLFAGNDGQPCRLKRINGKPPARYATISRAVMEGRPAVQKPVPNVQLTFTDVTGQEPDNPFTGGDGNDA